HRQKCRCGTLQACATGLLTLLLCFPASAQRQMEKLGRGVIAMRNAEKQVYIGWRLLGDDPSTVAFNLYRASGGKAPVKLNKDPPSKTTDFLDGTFDPSQSNSYTVRAVIAGKEQPASKPFTLAANAPVRQYLEIPIQQPPGGTSPDGRA